MGFGDRLASGARSVTLPAAPKISQAQWDAMWQSEEKTEPSKVDGEQLQRESAENNEQLPKL